MINFLIFFSSTIARITARCLAQNQVDGERQENSKELDVFLGRLDRFVSLSLQRVIVRKMVYCWRFDYVYV